MDVASRLKRLRAQRGFTQMQLAKQAGVSPTTVRSLELGRSKPQAATIQALADALGIEFDDLWKPKTDTTIRALVDTLPRLEREDIELVDAIVHRLAELREAQRRSAAQVTGPTAPSTSTPSAR